MPGYIEKNQLNESLKFNGSVVASGPRNHVQGIINSLYWLIV